MRDRERGRIAGRQAEITQSSLMADVWLANPAAQIGTQLGYQLIWSRGSAGTEFREYDSFHLGAFPEQLTAGSAPTSAAQVVTAVLLSRSC